MLVKSVGNSRKFLVWEVDRGLAIEAQLEMTKVLVERHMEDDYGISMIRERGGYSLYLVKYRDKK